MDKTIGVKEPKHGLVVYEYKVNKIWRELVGHQIDLMLSTNQQSERIISVPGLRISWSVFDLPPHFHPPIPLQTCHKLCVSYMGHARRLMELIGISSFSDVQWSLCLSAAMVLPFRDLTRTAPYGNQVPVVTSLYNGHLQLQWSDDDKVTELHIILDKLVSLIPYLTSEYESEYIEVAWKDTSHISSPSRLRVLTGLVLRHIRENWRVALVLAMLLYPADISCFIDSEKRRELFKIVEAEILKLGLDNVWESELLLTGQDIMNILDLKPCGEVVGEWQTRVRDWQLARPSGTEDDCIKWIKEAYKTSFTK